MRKKFNSKVLKIPRLEIKNPFQFVIQILKLDGTFHEQIITEKGDLIIKPTQKFNNYLEKSKKIKQKTSDLSNLNLFNNQNLKQENSTHYYLLKDYANLGYATLNTDLNQDGSEDLVLGAPTYSELNANQNGAVFIKYARDNGQIPFQNLDLDKQADQVIKPPNDTISSRFGHSVIVIDLNLDGINDLVVSAPSYGLQSLTYKGAVYVYFGDSNHQFDQEKPSLKLTCKNLQYCNFGWSLSKGDLNGDNKDDLIVSSPYSNSCEDQCGLVAVLLAKNTSFNAEIDLNQFDWILQGNMQYEWFGFSTRLKYNLLAVGAPQSRICPK